MENPRQNSIRVVICDPDLECALHMKEMLDDVSELIHPIRSFQTLFAMETYITDVVHGNIEVLILDIDTERMAVRETVMRLWHQFPHLLVIFVTKEPAAVASKVFSAVRPYAPFGLLTKPLDCEQVRLNLTQAVEHLRINAQRTFIMKTQFGLTSIAYGQMLFAESEKRILHIYMNNGRSYDSYMRMDVLEEAMPVQFLRIHQSYLVNLDYASQISENSLILFSGDTLPVSRNYKTTLKERLVLLKGTG